MVGALEVLALLQAEVESQDDQVGGGAGLLVGGCVGDGHDGVDNAEGDGFLLSDQRILDPVGFKLPGDPHVQSAVGMGVCGLPGVWEANQEMGCSNRLPCVRNRILPKLVQFSLGVLGVSDTVPVYLKELNARYG